MIIDSYININIGFWEITKNYHIPMYWVLENGIVNNEKQISSKDICIGNSGIEEDILLIKNSHFLPMLLVQNYIDEKNIQDDSFENSLKKITNGNNLFGLKNKMFLDASDWSLNTWRFIFHKLNFNKRNLENLNIEDDILSSLALYLLKHMHNDFFDKESYLIYKKYQNEIEESLNLKKSYKINFIKNIKNKKRTGRNIIKGNVIWGYSLEDYQKEKNFEKYMT